MSTPSKSEQRLFYVLAISVVASLLLLYLARQVVIPFVIAFALAYLLDPVVDKLQTWKLSRTTSVIILMSAFFVLILVGGLVLIPLFKIQVERLAQSLPQYLGYLEEWIHPYLEMIGGIDSQEIKKNLVDTFRKLGTLPLKIVGSATELAWKSLSSLVNILLMLVNLLIIPVAMFYLLRDYDEIIDKMKDMVPHRYRDKTTEIVKEIDEVLSAFVRGQLMVATLMALMYAVGLFICGTPMSLFIGIIAGYANLVPYLGLVFGFVPAAFLTFLHFQEWSALIGVVAVFGVVQAMEGMVITPRVVGDRIGLHPVAIMLAVLIGAEIFGFAGVLLAVPVTAVLNVLRRRAVRRYKKSSLFN